VLVKTKTKFFQDQDQSRKTKNKTKGRKTNTKTGGRKTKTSKFSPRGASRPRPRHGDNNSAILLNEFACGDCCRFWKLASDCPGTLPWRRSSHCRRQILCSPSDADALSMH